MARVTFEDLGLLWGLASVTTADTERYLNDGSDGMYLADRKAIVTILDPGPAELEGERVEDILGLLTIEWRSPVAIEPLSVEDQRGALVFEVRPDVIVEDDQSE